METQTVIAARRGKNALPTRAVGWASTAVTDWMRACIKESGGDPSVIPDEPFRFMRLREVEQRTGISRSNIYRRIEAGTFPAAVLLGDPSEPRAA